MGILNQKDKEWRLTGLVCLFEALMTAAFLWDTRGLVAVKTLVKVPAEYTGDLQAELEKMRWELPEKLEYFLTRPRWLRMVLMVLLVALLWLLLVKLVLKWNGLRGVGLFLVGEGSVVGLVEVIADKLERNMSRCAALEEAVRNGCYTVLQGITRYERVTTTLLILVGVIVFLEILSTWISVKWELNLSEILLPVFSLCFMGVLLQLLGGGKTAAVQHFLHMSFGISACMIFSLIGTLRLSKGLCYGVCYTMIFIAVVSCVLGHISSPTNGSAAWIRVLGVSIQTGELFKIFEVIFYSYAFRYLQSDKNLNTLSIITSGVLSSALLFENDTGNMAILCSILLIVSITDDFLIGGCLTLCLAVGLPTLMRFAEAYGSIRSLPLSSAFAHIGSRFSGALTILEHQNINQGTFRMTLLSMLKGGVLGTGPAGSRSSVFSTYAPANDYAFPSCAAVWGVTGILAVVLPLLLLLHNSDIDYRFVRKSENFLAGKLGSSVLVIQAIVHIGSSMNLFPFIGTNYPFLSSGGSSMGSSFVLIGVVLSSRLGDAQNRWVYDRMRQVTHNRLWKRCKAAVRYAFGFERGENRE